MAVNLTEGAISMISSGEWQATDVKPVLQVMDIRIVQTQASGNNGENKERYRVLLSDGVFHQQGMLATQRNELVRSQQLQKGSVVQLTEFVCNTIRERIIIIIIDLNVILDKCDIIGDAKPCPVKLPGNEAPLMARPAPPVQPSLNPPSTTTSNPQPFTGSSSAAPVTRPNFNAAAPVQTHGNPFHNNSDSGRYNSNNAAFMNSKTNSAAVTLQPPANNRMHPVQPPYHNQPPPMYGNRGPVAKNEAPPRIIPIAALNPYQGRWTIKARVTAKGELRRYNNAKGDGKVFSFDLLDSDGGEIRATCFNAVADQFYDLIEVGKVYYISKGTLKPAQKAFNHLKNDHEITLDNNSTVQPCFDDDTSIPHQQFHFRSISEIEGMDSNSILDIIGVVSCITPSSSIMRKNGMETCKRSVHLKDMSGKSIELTLWGNFCNAEGQILQNMCDSGVFPVVAVKSARVYDFNGKSVGTVSTSQLCIEPDFPEAQKLKTWFESVGKNTPSVSISRETISRTDVFKTISKIKDEKLGTSEKPDWITVSATIWHLKVENFCYTACPIMINDRQCSKKVVNNGDGKWRCDRCDQTVDECDYRYILQLQIQDHTGLTWVTAFQESGEEIMGVSAKELYFMKNEEQDEDRFTETVRNVLFTKHNFKLKVKEEFYSDEQRVKSTVVKAEKINFSSNTKILLLDLQRMHKREDPSSIGAKLENSGSNPQFGNVGFKETAPPVVNYAGNVTGIGQQAVFPASHVGHFGNQYGGSVGGNSGATGECYKCHQPGHWARDCPGANNVPPSYGSERINTGLPSGGGHSGTSGECYKCHQSGHWARDCPGANSVPPSYGSERINSGVTSGGGNSGASGECYKCHQMGHWARDCPGVSDGGQGRYGSASKQYVGGY